MYRGFSCIAMLLYFFLNAVAPSTMAINQNAMKMKNIILAIDAAPAAIPVKPKIAATIAIIKNVAVHLSIQLDFKMNNVWMATNHYSNCIPCLVML